MTVVWLGADAARYPEGGGHLWAYLNWALGLQKAGCTVVWLDVGNPDQLRTLGRRLSAHGVVLAAGDGDALEAAADADLLLNLRYRLAAEVVSRFRRSALVDIDPGLTQVWLNSGQMTIADHDLYFSTGERVGRLDPDRTWLQTTPCVSLEQWPLQPPPNPVARFTTVSHWWADEWVTHEGELFRNDKRAGFLPFLDLPQRTGQSLELALTIGNHEAEMPDRQILAERGWSVRDAWTIVRTPDDYRKYVQRSAGEFSAAKPSAVKLGNGWISDRTVCYLASGRPAVVQYTGPSSTFPHGEGVFRVSTVEEAALALDVIASDYERHSAAARSVAEEHFDATKVVRRVLERAL
jgi:hypothetical protein